MSAPVVTVPGVYDLSDEGYHGDPVPGGSLSVSGAKKLLPPSCPAIFDYERKHGRPPKREFDLGHAAHRLVLGTGPELYVVDGDDYRKKATQAEAKEARADGAVPLLPHEFDQVQAMAAKLREHPRYEELFTGGVAEQSLFWTDRDTGVMCRARLDYLNDRVVDYKTCASTVDLGHISKIIDNFNYHQQADWYLDGVVELDLLPPDAEFVFVFQSKEPPYLVQAVDLDATALKIGRGRNRFAREIYRDCSQAELWPAYSDDIETVSLPGYALRRHFYEGEMA